MNALVIACRAAIVAAALFGSIAAAHALKLAPGQRAQATEDLVQGCVGKRVSIGDTAPVTTIRSICACYADNMLNDLTPVEARQMNGGGAPLSVQNRATQIWNMCTAQASR